MRTLIVLGTGTDVGKTYASQTLIDLLTDQCTGPVIGLKPVESGVSADVQSDAAILASHSRPPLVPDHAFALKAPVSPHLAARLEEKNLSVARVVDWTRSIIARLQATGPEVNWLVVETAGGVFSPLNSTETNATLAAALDPALWLLLAPDRLGVLHELTATLKALELLARKPDLVLLNSPASPDASTGTNRAEIERLGIAEIAGVLPRNGRLPPSDQAKFLERLKH
jgi:dethiobiotin synthetase